MDYFKSEKFDELVEYTRILAMEQVLHPNIYAFLRQIFRWYSEKFHTPLTQVYDIPIDFILQHYYESLYFDLEDDFQIKEEITELLLSPAEKKKKLLQKDADKYADEEFAKQVEEEALSKKIPPIPDIIEQPIENTDKSPPDIKMEFVDDNLFKDWESEDSLLIKQKPCQTTNK